MIQEQGSSPPKVLEWIANNSFLNAITKTPLRRATTTGISAVVLSLALHQLIPELRVEPTQTKIVESAALGLAGFVAHYTIIKASDAAKSTYRLANDFYQSYKK